jgi:NADPH:quinone reductase-like Zn-dependent oxidoreductase
MRAVLFKKSGSVDGLVLADVPKPVPTADEVLVRVHATTVTRGDVVLRKMPFLLARVFGQRRKSTLGHEFAGQIESVGAGVARCHPGEGVFGTTTGLTTGTYAEFICMPADGMLVTLPANVRHDEAAPVPIGGMTALHFLRSAGLRAGQRLLVYGASGSVGSFAVQLGQYLGARVTAVSSTRNLELVKSLGADEVIDYTREDFTKADHRFDVVFDAVGKTSAKRSRAVTTEGGSFVSVQSSQAGERIDDLRMLRDLLASGAIRALIDRRYPLEQIPEAHRYVEQGRKRGNVVITVTPTSAS